MLWMCRSAFDNATSFSRAVMPSPESLPKAPFASILIVNSSAGHFLRISRSISSSSLNGSVPTLSLMVLNPLFTRMSTCSSMPSALSIQTKPLIVIPPDHWASPPLLRLLNAVSTANLTEGSVWGISRTLIPLFACSVSKNETTSSSDSMLSPGMRLHSPTPLRPCLSQMVIRKLGL